MCGRKDNFHKYIKKIKNFFIQLLILLYEIPYIKIGRGLELNNLF